MRDVCVLCVCCVCVCCVRVCCVRACVYHMAYSSYIFYFVA